MNNQNRIKEDKSASQKPGVIGWFLQNLRGLRSRQRTPNGCRFCFAPMSNFNWINKRVAIAMGVFRADLLSRPLRKVDTKTKT